MSGNFLELYSGFGAISSNSAKLGVKTAIELKNLVLSLDFEARRIRKNPKAFPTEMFKHFVLSEK